MHQQNARLKNAGPEMQDRYSVMSSFSMFDCCLESTDSVFKLLCNTLCLKNGARTFSRVTLTKIEHYE